MNRFSVPFSLYDFFAILLPGSTGLFGVYLFLNPGLTPAGHEAIFGASVIGGINGEIALITVLIILSYLAGHILNSLSELIVDKPFNRLGGWSASHYLQWLGLVADKGIIWTARQEQKILGKGWKTKPERILGLFLPYRLYISLNPARAKPNGKLLKKCVEKKFGNVFSQHSFTYLLVRTASASLAPDAAGEAKIFIASSVMFQSLSLAMILIMSGLIRAFGLGVAQAGIFWIGTILALAFIVIFLGSYRRYKRLWVEIIYTSFISAVCNEKK